MQTAAESSWRQQSAPSGQFSWQKTILRPEESAQEAFPRCAPSACPLWPQQLWLHTECGNLVIQRIMAHLNWLRSQSAPLVPKTSKEKGSRARICSCTGLSQGGGTTLPSVRQHHPLTQHLGTVAGVSPAQRPPSTSSHLLGKGLESPSPPGLDISSPRHLALGIRHTATPEFSPHVGEQL